MALIFWFSHQPSTISAEMSHGLLERVILLFQDVFPITSVYTDVLHSLVRKGAHFFIYFVLGLLVMVALQSHEKVGNKGLLVRAVLICGLYAMSDEYHQTYIAGRSGQWSDVLIDTSGALLGCFKYLWISKLYK
jgi:VanZ family protein